MANTKRKLRQASAISRAQKRLNDYVQQKERGRLGLDGYITQEQTLIDLTNRNMASGK